MLRPILVAALVFVICTPVWAHERLAYREAVRNADGLGQAVQQEITITANYYLQSSSILLIAEVQKLGDLAENSAAGAYKVDPDALMTDPDDAELRQEAYQHFIRPCYTKMLTSRKVEKRLIKILLPQMIEEAERQVGGLIDLLVEKLRGADSETRATMYELNHESCLRTVGVKK